MIKTLEQITALAEEAGIKVRNHWVTDNIPVESLVALYALGADSRDAEVAELEAERDKLCKQLAMDQAERLRQKQEDQS